VITSPLPIDPSLSSTASDNDVSFKSSEERMNDIYNTWKEQVKDTLQIEYSKENADNMQEKKHVRFAESPRNKPSLVLKRKPTTGTLPSTL
jgi:hypothetical protein